MTPKQFHLAQHMIDVAYRAEAKKLHPDIVGGAGEAMSELTLVRDILKRLCKGDLRPDRVTGQATEAPSEITMRPEQTVGGR